MSTTPPENIYRYFDSRPDEFEERQEPGKKRIRGILALLCLVPAVWPQLVGFAPSFIRIAAIIAVIGFALLFFLGGKAYYSKKTGGKINFAIIKKFDSDSVTEEELLAHFHANNFAALAEAASRDNQPVQLYLCEDLVGKVFYIQFMKYFTSSDFRGITEVKVVSGPEYDKHYAAIKKITATGDEDSDKAQTEENA